MILSSAIPVQHHDGMRARTRLRIAAVQCTTYRVLAIIIQNEVRMSISFEPSRDLSLVTLDSIADYVFRRCTIRVRRGSRDVALFPQTRRKLLIGAADVPLERVSAARLVNGQIVPACVALDWLRTLSWLRLR